MEVTFNIFMFNVFPWIVLIGLAFYGLILKIDQMERQTLKNIQEIFDAFQENSVEIDHEDNGGDDTDGDDDISIPEDNTAFPIAKSETLEDFSDEDSNLPHQVEI